MKRSLAVAVLLALALVAPMAALAQGQSQLDRIEVGLDKLIGVLTAQAAGQQPQTAEDERLKALEAEVGHLKSKVSAVTVDVGIHGQRLGNLDAALSQNRY